MDAHLDLERFLEAQAAGGIYQRATTELRSGRKTSHWMWFVFPQIVGLGQSATARHFAISSLEEARAYLDHEVLGPRLIECARIVADLEARTARQVFGELDAQKLRSSMTLFLRAKPSERLFQLVLDRLFAGQADPMTDALLAARDATAWPQGSQPD